ncbi:tellurite resistance TerB family protein [Brevundimonas sp. R86498]|uniref:tellurite resistance TerB family protein n=1 Tax=Brevundimonas sp. R86498 TaxID=3093845 RepID=UPI0037C9B730
MPEGGVERLLRKVPDVDPADLWTPGDLVQMEAVAAACALVAHADGWVTPDESRRMVDRLRRSSAVAVFGVEEVVVAFEAVVRRLERDIEDGEATAEVAIRRLRGQPGPSRLLVDTACAIAEADGGFDAEEREVLLRLCTLVGLDPAAHGLAPGGGVPS